VERTKLDQVTTVNIHAAKTHLSRLVDRAAAGEEIIIARAGKPVARLAPLRSERRRPGLLRGRLTVARDFDAALPAAILNAFYGGQPPPSRRRK
jgi:prevent-host-death family protein